MSQNYINTQKKPCAIEVIIIKSDKLDKMVEIKKFLIYKKAIANINITLTLSNIIINGNIKKQNYTFVILSKPVNILKKLENKICYKTYKEKEKPSSFFTSHRQ